MPGKLTAVQRGVLRNALAALVANALVLAGARLLVPAPSVNDAAADRLAFALPWMLVSLAPLLAAVGPVARYRFMSPAAADGSNPDGDRALAVRRSYLQNTLEQLVLHIGVMTALAVVAPVRWLSLVPVLSVWFLVARVLFRVGYPKGAAGRAFGFGATFYMTIMAYVLALWFWILG